MSAFVDLSGQVFGRLTVLHRLPAIKPREHVRWLCRCECGKETVVPSNSLRQGVSQSCGCFRQETTRARSLTHGHSIDGVRSGTHSVWHGMLQRCSNPVHKNWSDYGGRGIRVCERWLSFESFLADMGEKPEGATIERRDNDGHYEPGNCYWTGRIQQARNRRNSVYLTKDGVTRVAEEWSELLGLKAHTIRRRLYRGATDEEALAPITRYKVPLTPRKRKPAS